MGVSCQRIRYVNTATIRRLYEGVRVPCTRQIRFSIVDFIGIRCVNTATMRRLYEGVSVSCTRQICFSIVDFIIHTYWTEY